jgi:TonB-dependent starch-binding outer membrane protein SusC
MKNKGLLISAFVILLPLLMLAQEKQIRGTVTDESGTPVPDVTVTLKGSSTGTRTDGSGNFTLTVPDNGKQTELIFSHVNFQAKTETFSGNQVSTKLAKTVGNLDEVIVVGYGTQKKKDITGAVATFNTEQLDERPLTRVDQALVGQMAGVRVKQTSGVPGRGFSVQVRGTGSIGANNEPLYVIDGFPLEVAAQNVNGGFSTGNPLDNINPNDIESIQVLKDASASAIYGSRASNGVVLITTKKGKAGKATINVNTYAGYNERVRKLKMLSAEEWVDRAIEMINAAWVASATNGSRTAAQTTAQRRAILGISGINPTYMIDDRWLMPGHPGLTYVDWQDEFFRKGLVQNYQLSASGGNETVKYYLSGNYMNQDGIAWGVTNRSYSARANLEVNASNKVKFGLNLAPSYSIINDPGVDGKDQESHIAASLTPVVEDSVGLLTAVYPYINYTWGGTRVSPVERIKRITGETKLFRTLSTIYGEYAIIPGLTLRSSLNLDNADATRKSYTPYQVAQIAAVRVPTGGLTGYKRLTFTNENTLSYNKTFAEKHTIAAVVGMSYTTFKLDSLGMAAGTYSTIDITTLNAAINNTASTTETRNVLISYFGRVQYDFDNRYLLSASLRRDGSSKFGDNTKWGVFPAASVGWRISQEKFFENVRFVNELKLRGSWGIAGNNGYYGDYNHLSRLSFANYSFGGTQANGQIINPTIFPNPDLSWEESETINIGLDIGVLKNRLFASVDYYTKRNTNLLLSIPVPQASGFSTAFTNIGEVLNKGWELEITSRNISTRQLTWTTNINLSHNTNEVKKLGPNNTPILFNGGFDIEHSILMVGQPMYSIFVVKEIGVLTHADTANKVARFGTQGPGDPKYFDANKDGKIDANDRVLSGHPNPDYTWGINNTVNYKGFDLSVLVQGQWGGKIYSMFGRAVDRTGQGVVDNTLKKVTNRWRSAADDGKEGLEPKAYSTWGRIKNTDWLYSSDYWRVRTITLGYNLGRLFSNNVIKGARIYATAENMFGGDKYDGGWNPEAVNSLGEDYGSFPLSKGIVFGLNLTF